VFLDLKIHFFAGPIGISTEDFNYEQAMTRPP